MRNAILPTTLIAGALMLTACSTSTTSESQPATPSPLTPSPAATSTTPARVSDLAAAKSDAKTVATWVETYFTGYQEYPATVIQNGDSFLIPQDGKDFLALGDPEWIPLSPGTTLTYRLGKDGQAFCIAAVNNGQTAVYASDNNGLQSRDGLTPASYCDTYTMPTPTAESIALLTDEDVAALLNMEITSSTTNHTDTTREITWIGKLSNGEDITATIQVVPQELPEGTSWMNHARTSIEEQGYELVEMFKSQYTAEQTNGNTTTYLTVRDAYPYDIRAIITAPNTTESYSSTAIVQMLANMQQQAMGIE